MNTIPKRIDDPGNTESGIDYSIPSTITMHSSDDSKPEGEIDKNLTGGDRVPSSVPPKILPPYLKPLEGNFQLLQLWEGRVTEINKQTFWAIVSDKTNPSLPDELVELDIEEISPGDISLLNLGSVFYWSIRYADYPGRGRAKESKIRFRRIPGWTIKEIEQAKNVGEKLASYFKRD